MSSKIDARYPEESVGIVLQAFLSLVTFPINRFSIQLFTSAHERERGADGLLTDRIIGFMPFYMQFKRPSAYPAKSGSKIIRQRKSLKLTTDPMALFFPLRKKRDGQDDSQHNILFRLRQSLRKEPIGDAAYVCPLFLDYQVYFNQLHQEASHRQQLREWPFIFEDIWLRHQSGNAIPFGRIPCFPAHVSIPPHDAVETEKHIYSFTQRGEELCFHSPVSLPEGAMTFSDWMKDLEDLFRKKKIIYPDIAFNKLQDLLKDTDIRMRDLPYTNKDGIHAWLSFGRFLKDAYNIDQFAFVQWQ